MRIAVALTGASGVVLGFRLLDELAETSHDVCCIITDNAKKVIAHEMGDSNALPARIVQYSEHDANAPINSSSVAPDIMIVVPCSLKTLSAIANGYSENLVIRAAENTLRTNGKLIVVPRETPLSASVPISLPSKNFF